MEATRLARKSPCVRCLLREIGGRLRREIACCLIINVFLLTGNVGSASAGCSLTRPIVQPLPQSQETQNATLEMGKPVERELSGGQSHSYQIQLTKGQFVHVVVDQRGIDVVVALYGPDGQKLTEVDSPNGAEGPEPISWIAETTGSYRLEVRSLEKDAKQAKYEARIETLREAMPQDAYRVRGERALAEATRLRSQGTAESLHNAIKRLSEAVADFRSVGASRDAAGALNDLGNVHHSLGTENDAIGCYAQALLIYRQVGDRGGEATSLNNIGAVHSALGEKEKALEKYGEALPTYRQIGDRRGEARTLNNIGVVYSDLGEIQKALEKYNEALPIIRQVGDRRGEATTLDNIARVYSDLGDKRKSLETYNEALPIYQQVGDRRGEATTLGNIGEVYSYLGEKQKALEKFNEALLIHRQVGDWGAPLA